MSKKIQAVFEEYLKEYDILELKTLGGSSRGTEDAKVPDQRASELLSARLLQQAKVNNTIIMLAVGMLFVLFAIGIYLIIHYQDDVKTIGLIFGGTFLSLLGIVGWLRKLWIDKNLLDMSAGIIGQLSPAEAAKYVETMYLNMRKENG